MQEYANSVPPSKDEDSDYISPIDYIQRRITRSRSHLISMSSTLLLLKIFNPSLQIRLALELLHIHRRNKERRLGKEIAHLLERPLGCLGEEGPEEESVGEIADLRETYQSSCHQERERRGDLQ